MSCGQTSPESQVHLSTTTTDPTYHWFGWMPAIGLDHVKAVLRSHAVSGNFQVRLAMQTALIRTEQPEAPTTLDQLLVGDGERCTGVISVADSTSTKFFVRFGVAYSLSSGSALGQADLSFAVSHTQCGQLVGGRSLSLASCTSADAVATVTGFVPAILVQKVKAVTVCRSLTGNFQFKLCYRTATTSKENPSAWTALTNYEGAGEFDSGDLALNVDSSMYVQFGILYHSSSGAGDAQVDTTFAVRRG